MSKLRQFVAVILCMVLLSSTSQAWFDVGHMAVAYVAYQQLTAVKKARVAALLKKNPYYNTKWKAMIPAGTPADQRDLMLFMIAATWPDEIKLKDSGYQSDGDTPPTDGSAWTNTGYGDLKQHRYWHFIDIPFTQDGTAPLAAIPSPNAETQIAVFRQTLTSGSSDKLKSYDLVWLMHVVGDVHQPLHSTTRISAGELNGDNGGNSEKIDATAVGNTTKKLHLFWDSLPGDAPQPGDALTMAINYAKALAPADPVLAKKMDASDWINESFNIAETSVYTAPISAGDGPFIITPEYRDQAQKIAAQRVALAGQRLANLINNELK
jgi:S1/P1 nuclease